MRINQMRVKNFRGFKDQTFDFSRGADGQSGGSFHLLIGDNATGKTAVLEALAVAAGSWLLGIRGYDSRHIWDPDIRRVIYFNGDTTRQELQFPVSVAAEGVVQQKRLQWARELHGGGGRTTTKNATSIKKIAEDAVQKVREGGDVTLPLFSYYGSDRLWREPKFLESQIKEIPSRLDGYLFSADSRIDQKGLWQWLGHEKYAALDKKRESPQFGAARDAMRGCIEGAKSVDFDVRLQKIVVRFEAHEPQSFDTLSDGQRNMLAMVGDIARKAALLNPHFGGEVLRKTPGIVLIDELDLHLHPRWQRRVIGDLRKVFPSLQFFATTHSPFLVQAVTNAEIVVLDEPPPEGSNARGLEEVARFIMGVDTPEMSARYKEMLDTARDYFRLLEKAKDAPEDKKKELRDRLTVMTAPYSDNPVYVALLERKRHVAGLE